MNSTLWALAGPVKRQMAVSVGLGLLVTAGYIGQGILAALILDHFGFFGLPRQPVNLTRIVGVALVLAGAVLVRRG